MAVKRTPSESAEVVPTEADAVQETPAAVAADPAPAAPDSSVVRDADETAVPDTAVHESAVHESAVHETAVSPSAPAHQVVYVEAPKPFVAKGNRGFGVLIALLSTVIFAVLYAVAELIAAAINHVSSVDLGFLSDLDFYAPVLMFAVGFILLALIVNRAGWAAHVIGSILVGLVVLFGGTAVILLLHVNQIPSNRVGEAFSQVLFSTGTIVAALLGREVALWMGFAIAARGRRVKVRNVEARELYDQEIAAKRAEYEQANARSGVVAPAAEPVTAEPVVAEPAASAPVESE